MFIPNPGEIIAVSAIECIFACSFIVRRMKTFRPLLVSLLLLHLTTGVAQEQDSVSSPVITRQFGLEVSNPYLWMEQLNDSSTQQWIAAQEERTWDLLGTASRGRLKNTLSFNVGDEVYKLNKYQFRLDQYDKKPSILKFRRDERHSFAPLLNCKDYRTDEFDIPAVENYWVTADERYVVVALSHSGSDWLEFVIMEMKTQTQLTILKGILQPWLIFKDDGFLYQHFQEPEASIRGERIDQKVNYHVFGTQQSEDQIIFRNADRSGERTFTIFQRDASSSRIYVQYPFKVEGTWKYAISKMEIWDDLILPEPFMIYESDYDVDFQPIREDENDIYFRTNFNAANYCLIRCNLSAVNDFEIVHKEYKEVMTDAVYLGSNAYGLTYFSKGAYSGLLVKNGLKRGISVPVGAGISFNAGSNESTAFFSLKTHYLYPEAYRIHLNQLSSAPVGSSQMYARGNYNVEIHTYTNDAGEEMPMWTVSHDSDVRNHRGVKPVLMHVYGGYGEIMEPYFSWENHYFLLNGGILAYPAVRGGGELGTMGELAGKGLQKSNGIADLIAAAQHLVDKGVVETENLFLEGHSHGGFLVAAAAIERPDLFGGVITYAGVFDLLRYEDFGVRTLIENLSEFGDPTDSVDFHNLHRLSPIHQLKKGVEYPSFFILAGTNNSRVPASNSLRFKALLDEYSTNAFNVLFVTNGGHGVINYPRQQLEIIGMKFQFIYELTGQKMWKFYK